MLRVVLDANVIVSALIRAEGPAGQIVARIAADAQVAPIVSPAILAEYRRSLAYPKVRRCLALPAAEVEAWVDALALLCEIVPGKRSVLVVKADPDDDKYLAAALEGSASFVVSGDHHLLDVGAYEGIRIVSPRAFLGILDEHERR